MSDSKSPSPTQPGFLQKVAKFVANPATDWHDLSVSPTTTMRDTGYDKQELKAMIERKQRNDFVRKREFDMLRKIRRDGGKDDGSSDKQHNASQIDDSEPPRQSHPSEVAVKAKIDAIERQMVGESFQMSTKVSKVGASATETSPPSKSPVAASEAPTVVPDVANAPTEPLNLDDVTELTRSQQARAQAQSGGSSSELPPDRDLAAAAPRSSFAFNKTPEVPAKPSSNEMLKFSLDDMEPIAPSAIVRGGGQAAAPTQTSQPQPTASSPASSVKPVIQAFSGGLQDPFTVEVSEVAHDPELDEAVIAFANADFEQCEKSITQLVSHKGSRYNHAETWLVLFDFYRAIGEQEKFDDLAIDYAEHFGYSAPQWFSMPRQVASATIQQHPTSAPKLSPVSASSNSSVGWICPPTIDLEAVKRLRTQTLQLPLPWVLDWNGVSSVEAEACGLLSSLMRVWSRDTVSMVWVGGERLLQVLQEASPLSVRDIDPAIWLLKLEVLRLANRPDQFDVAAIDYCVTYEVSPPSWEAAKCTVKLVSELGAELGSSPLATVSEASTGFVETQTHEDPDVGQIVTVELSGQLTGDISPTLRTLENTVGDAKYVTVNCARLIRVDFIAAGDILNWVLNRRSDEHMVQFEDAHRLVALFFGAMGINEHAKVKVRLV